MSGTANKYGFVPDDASHLPAEPSGEAHNYGFVADPPEESPGILARGIQAIQAGGKGLDYLRGSVGAPLEAGAIKLATGKNPLSMNNYTQGLKPNNLSTVPSGAEMLEKAGVGPGPSVADFTKWIPGVGGPLIQKGDPMDITARGAGGAVMDAAADPLTYLSLGANQAAKVPFIKGLLEMPGIKNLAALATAPSRATSDIGKKLFSWGITPVEQAGERFGKHEVADTMYKYGIKGTSGQIAEKMDNVAGQLKSGRDAILHSADAAGATVDRGAAFKDFEDTLNQMVADRRISPEDANKIHAQAIGTYTTGGDPSTMLGTQWKTDMYKSLPQKAYDVTKNPNLGQSLNKQASNGLKTAIEDSVERTLPGQGAELAAKNKDLGQLLSVMPATTRWSQLLERRPMVTPGDLAFGLGGSLMSDNPAKGAAMLSAKKLLEIGRLPWVRTNMGSMLRTVGEGSAAPYLDTLVRRGASGKIRQGQNNGQEN